MGFTVSVIDIKSAVLCFLGALRRAFFASLLYSEERAIFARMRRWRNLNNTPRTDSFSRTFYIANLLEIFERIAWYGFFTVSSLYMSSSPEATQARERGMRKFKSIRQAQRFLDAHAAVHNLFNLGRHLVRAEHYRNLRMSAFT